MKEKIENSLPYIFIGCLITVIVLGVWLYITKGNINVLEYQISELKEKLEESNLEVKEAEEAAKEANKRREEQFKESEKVIGDLKNKISERDKKILKEQQAQKILQEQIAQLQNRPEPDYSNTPDAELAEELTNRIRHDHPDKALQAVLVKPEPEPQYIDYELHAPEYRAAAFFFTREVAEAMNTSLFEKEGFEQQLKLLNTWIESKEIEVQNLKSNITDQNSIIDEKNEEIQSLLADYSAKSSEAAVLQSQNSILRDLNSDRENLIKQMKRRQWMERGVSFGAIAAIIIAVVASK